MQLRISEQQFIENELQSTDFSPVFFLSTGRTGTALFTQILTLDESLAVFHTPQPELIAEGKKAFELQRKGSSDVLPALANEFIGARGKLLWEAHRRNRTFVETNNRVTFHAPAIISIIPNARFVYVHRHPGEFIRSGVRRNWYQGHGHDIGRITANEEIWDDYTIIQKIAWLWNSTNGFIESFLQNVEAEKQFRLNFNELTTSNAKALTEFVGASVDEAVIASQITNPVNAQKTGEMALYEDWQETEKQTVRAICGELCSSYGYKL